VDGRVNIFFYCLIDFVLLVRDVAKLMRIRVGVEIYSSDFNTTSFNWWLFTSPKTSELF
jgi:hypothetical protein